MKNNILSILFSFILMSCSTNEQIHANKATFEYFQQTINPDMKYNSLEKTFGPPARDIGSGLHIYVYPLIDSTEIWIGYTDNIEYVMHIDKTGQLLHTLY